MASSNHFGREIATVATLCVLFGILIPSCCGCSGDVSFGSCTGDECRIIIFKEEIENRAMKGHVIRSEVVPNQGTCRLMCYMEPNCVSINFGPSEGGKYKCELNSASDENKLSFLEERKDFTFLAIENPCSSSPCLNGGTCQVGFTNKGFRCKCRHGFSGANCKGFKSCSHLKKHAPTAKSGIYVIDPDGEGDLPPLHDVTCNMTDKNGIGVTVISHDSETRTRVKGFEGEGSYLRNIQYKGANFSQLASLATVSLHCEQFIKYECKGSQMFKDKKYHAWWVSRDSVKMTYWGGAEPGSGKCACGMNNTCADPKFYCNCDKNDKGELLEDSGLLTSKTHLPVKQLRFGDTKQTREEGYHTLGKFRCYGIA